MKVDDLLKQPGAWLAPGKDTGIVVSSRIRLARNFRDAAFPGWAGEAECERIWKELQPILMGLKSIPEPFALGMGDLDELDRQVAEVAERMAPPASVALTVGAWASVVVFGLLCGLAAFVAVAR